MRYPFSPEVLDALPEELAELFRSLEETLLDEICSRLKLAGELNEVTVQDIRGSAVTWNWPKRDREGHPANGQYQRATAQ